MIIGVIYQVADPSFGPLLEAQRLHKELPLLVDDSVEDGTPWDPDM